ncbi:MAG: hypothetical protein WD176_04770 [Pirellulales bacterium]
MRYSTMRMFAAACAAALGFTSIGFAAEDLVIRKDRKATKESAPTAKAPAASKAAPAPKPQISSPPAKDAGKQAAPKHKPQVLSVTPKSGQSPLDAWTEFFQQRAAKDQTVEFDADVRETVRKLNDAKRHSEISALIQGALCAGTPQTWMYQALGMALVAQGAPKSEVERALMSAVDFAGNETTHLAYIAHFMARAGLDARAIKVFRQVSQLEPTRPEPYIHGLAIAQRTNDFEGIRWATLGILSQSWPADQHKHVVSAMMQAKATLDELRKTKKNKQALAYQRQLDAALARDLVVKITWTGDADVDMSVLEPAGTVCSFRNPRTAAGGVMSGDTYSVRNVKSENGVSESYVCAKAFPGDYELMVRRVWGKVTSGKVTVEIISHHKTAREKSVRSEVELGEGVNLVQFKLDEGRRVEPLAEQQVATVVREQAVLGREILAQQLGGVVDPRAIAALSSGRDAQIAALTGNGNTIIPFPIRMGAVGFRPVITTLPAGANLVATAVISADRRYVRITMLPLFSKIGKVLAFNIITGQITNGNPSFDVDAGDAGNIGGAGAGGPER